MPNLAHPLETRTAALTLLRAGTRNVDVASELRVPVGTIGYWLHEDRRRSGRLPGKRHSACPGCAPDEMELDRQPYAYLLGLYLGDGHIVDSKQQHTLAISCSSCWPGLMDACEAAIRAVMPRSSVWRRKRKGMRDVTSSSIHWIHLFPQHGPGRKHERPIVLKAWQQEIVDEFPEDFIRGLIHSDGCRVYNAAVHKRDGLTTRYYYARYHFTNESEHIRRLFTDTLDKLGIDWRYNNPRKNISIARRESVKRLDSFVGPKY